MFFEDVFAHLLTVDTKIATPIGQQSIQCEHVECFAQSFVDGLYFFCSGLQL